MNVLNKLNGEVLDLTVLWRVPKVKKSKSVKRYGYQKSQENHWMIVALAALLAVAALVAY